MNRSGRRARLRSAVAAALICAAVSLGDAAGASAAHAAVPDVRAEQSASARTGLTAAPQAMTAAITGAPAATTATASTPATISVTSVSAASITPGSTLVIRGTVRNNGTTRITGMRIGLNLDWPKLDQAGVAAWAARALTDRIGNSWASQSVAGPVPPGGTVAFTLTARSDALGLPVGADGFGPRGAAVEVAGDAGAGNRRLAVQRTFVVWDPKPGTTTSRLAVLVPITPPAKAASTDAGQPSPALLDEWSPTGRLTRLLTATADSGFGWAVDPSLISAATAAQSSGRTASGGGTSASASSKAPGQATPTPAAGGAGNAGAAGSGGAGVGGAGAGGTGAARSGGAGAAGSGAATPGASGSGPSAAGSATPSAAGTGGTTPSGAAATAKGWLDALIAGSRNRTVYALPWGDPDLSALAHANAVDLLSAAQDDALAVTQAAFGQPLDVTVGWPVDGLADAATLSLLARNTGRTVILSDATVPVPGSVTPTVSRGTNATSAQPTVARAHLPGTRPDVTGLVANRELSKAVSAMGGSGWALGTQRVLAELAAVGSAASTAGSASGSANGSANGSPDLTATGELFATVPRGWDPQPADVSAALGLLHAASWVNLEPVADARSGPAAAAAKTLRAYSSAAASAELPLDHVSAVADTFGRLQRFAPALPARASYLPPRRRTALSLVSQDWRVPQPDDAARNAALAKARAPLAQDVAGLYSGIGLLNTDVNLTGSSAPLLVTVTSTLKQPVNLILTLRSPNGRLRVGPSQAVSLDAATTEPARKSVRIEVVTGVAYGDVDLQATLAAAPDGVVPLYASAPGAIRIRIRRGWEDAGLIVSGTLLVGLLVFGLVRGVRRGRKRLPPDSAEDPDAVGRDPGWAHSRRRLPPDPDQPDDAPPPDDVVPPDDAAPPDGTPPPDEEANRPTEPIRTAQQWPVAGFPELAWPPTPRTVLVPDDTGPIPIGAGNWFPAPATTGVSSGYPSARTSSSSSASATVAWPDLISPPTTARARVDAPDQVPDRLQAAPTVQPQLPGQAPGQPPGQPPVQVPGEAPGATPGADAKFLRNNALMTAGTLVSRVLGMVRVVVLSAAIGAKASGDAFNTANTIPNSLFILIGGGVLNAVLVPQIVRAARRSDGGKDYVDRLLTLAIIVLGGAAIVMTAAAPLLMRVYENNWSAEKLSVGTTFAYWCLPQIFFYGLYTIYGQVLNARGSFGPYMWAPVVNNVVAIAGMGVYIAVAGRGVRPIADWSNGEMALLAGTTTLGVVAQALVLLPVMRRSGYTWRPRWGWRGVGLRSAGTVAGWTFAGVALSQAAFVVTSQVVNGAGDVADATTGASGGRTVFDTAYLLFMLPHSLVAVSLVTAVFTRMSTAAGLGRLDAVREDLSYTLRTVGTATVLSTVAFVALGPDLTYGLFLGTARSSTDAYAFVATAMLLGLVPFSAQYLFQRVFYAFEDARTPFLITLVTTAIWTVGNLVSRAVLSPEHVAVGVGVALSVSSAVGAAVTVVPLRRRLGTIDGARVLRTHVRLLVAGAGAGLLAVVVRIVVHAVLGDGRTASYAVLLLAGTAMVAAYILLLRVLRVTELDDLMRPLTNRLRRSRGAGAGAVRH